MPGRVSNTSPEAVPVHASTASPVTVAPTNPGNTPPTEVIIEQIPSDEDSIGITASIASSSMPSRRTTRLAALFPSTKSRFGPFVLESKTLKLLQDTLQLDVTFISRMEHCGFTKISIIVNRFGLDIRSISKSFALMGPSHVLDAQMYTQTLNLVMFARSQILNMSFYKHDTQDWFALKKSAKYNKAFDKWNTSRIDDLEEFLTDPHFVFQATEEMKLIRQKIRNWINKDDITINGSIKASFKTPSMPQPPQIAEINKGELSQSSFKTIETDLKKTVAEMESIMTAALTSVLENDLAT